MGISLVKNSIFQEIILGAPKEADPFGEPKEKMKSLIGLLIDISFTTEVDPRITFAFYFSYIF